MATAGARTADYLSGFFASIIGISSLGASITFALIVTDMRDTPHATNNAFQKPTLQTFVAVSWLLFVLDIGMCGMFAGALLYDRENLIRGYNTERDANDRFPADAKRLHIPIKDLVSVVSAVLYLFLIGAFMFLSLVVVGYVPGVGWYAVASTSIFGIVGVAIVIGQSRLPWW